MDVIKRFRELWRVSYRCAAGPVVGVSLGEKEASEVAEQAVAALMDAHPEKLPEQAKASSEILKDSRKRALAMVAEVRATSEDDEKFRTPGHRPYEKNPNLRRVRQRDGEGAFTDPEWAKLPPIFEPLGFAALHRKGVQGEDAKDLFAEAFAGLAKGRKRDGVAPVEQVTVFEELVPVFSTMLSNRVIDWARKMRSLKNQPNAGTSMEEMEERAGAAGQVADPASVGRGAETEMSFDDIFEECRDLLTDLEWRVVFEIYVSREFTRGQLIEQDEITEAMGLPPGTSEAKRRRHLNSYLESALSKLQKALRND